MSIYIKDEATSKAVRKLAKLRRVTLTEAVRLAVQESLAHETKQRKQASVIEAIRKIQVELSKFPKSGLQADKAFFDELSGDI
jgi:antitoxin VapB